MKILIIGGTVFLGRHLTEAALARRHEVTLFNRGQHNPELFPEVEKLRGNRDGEMDALKGRQWDAVIDTCGYFPRVVRQSAQLLADSVGHYTFISSISAYANFSKPGLDENSPLGEMDLEEAEAADKITNENYGPLKVLCEQEVEKALPGRALLIRPGLIVGPFDPSDRFTYWPVRVARGGEVLVPGTPELRLEIIDVRDLAEWNIRLIEEGKTGAYNATGPDYPLTMQMLLDECKKDSGSDASPTYVTEKFLKEQEVEPNSVNAWYISNDEQDFQYIWDMNKGKALGAGLTFRPLAATVHDTLEWSNTRPSDTKLKVGLEPEKEAELLAKLKSTH